MLASDFQRDDCLVGSKRRTYAALKRSWRCADCGGRIVGKHIGDQWIVCCGRCRSFDFVHEYEYERQMKGD